ncbi:hypothetical protein QJS66_20975 [Kocuria rhizophila]|nr:hypothetical protein QJS66_20975 [Kocuria rhizophila]
MLELYAAPQRPGAPRGAGGPGEAPHPALQRPERATSPAPAASPPTAAAAGARGRPPAGGAWLPVVAPRRALAWRQRRPGPALVDGALPRACANPPAADGLEVFAAVRVLAVPVVAVDRSGVRLGFRWRATTTGSCRLETAGHRPRTVARCFADEVLPTGEVPAEPRPRGPGRGAHRARRRGAGRSAERTRAARSRAVERKPRVGCDVGERPPLLLSKDVPAPVYAYAVKMRPTLSTSASFFPTMPDRAPRARWRAREEVQLRGRGVQGLRLLPHRFPLRPPGTSARPPARDSPAGLAASGGSGSSGTARPPAAALGPGKRRLDAFGPDHRIGLRDHDVGQFRELPATLRRCIPRSARGERPAQSGPGAVACAVHRS